MSAIFYSDRAQRILTFVLLGLLAGTIVVVALMAAVPPVSRDALTHHLALPKLYLQHGGVYEIPALKYSYYPMNLDLLYLIALYFKNDIIPKYIHLAFGLLTCGIIYIYLVKRLSRPYALIGVISFLSLPLIIKLSITVYVDLGLVCFSTACLYFFFKWLGSGYALRPLLISAVFCGLALGTKYNGLLVLLLMTLFIAYAYVSLNADNPRSWGKAIGYMSVFVITALLVFSPWMIKNYLWTHNPIFPLYDAFFNPDAPYRAIPLKPIVERRLIYHESWSQIILIPFRIFFQGQDNNPQYFDGRLNPFLLLLPLFAFHRMKTLAPLQKMERKLLAAFAILYILYAFFTKDMRVRYIAPALPALVLLSVFGLKNIYDLAQSAGTKALRDVAILGVHGAMVLMLALNGTYMVGLFKEVEPLSYITRQVDRDTYIQKHRPEYAALQYINSHLPSDIRLLAIFMGRRSYYADRHMVFGIEWLKETTQTAQSSGEIWQAISAHDFTHLIVGRRLYDKWIQDIFNHQERVRLNDFWRRYTDLIYYQRGYEVYRLRKTASDSGLKL